MRRITLAVSLACGVFAGLSAQFIGQAPPSHDICAMAIHLEAGDRLSGQSNAEATLSMASEKPAVLPSTCIQTIENDLWYKFKAEKGAESYEIQIVSEFCNTPAGLQALLIQAEDCNASTFIYRGCSNKMNTDTIKLFLEAPDTGQNYFIWIDGYDGTICKFSITLKTRSKLSATDLRFRKLDHSLNDLPQVPLEDLEASFSNNVATLTWSAASTDPTELYIVELLPDVGGFAKHSQYGRVVGYVNPHHFVGTGSSQYTFTDFVTHFE